MSKLANGIYFNPPHERAPEFVIGKLSILAEKFMDWLKEQPANEKGYVKLDIKRSKEGNIYLALDDWKPRDESKPDDGIPF